MHSGRSIIEIAQQIQDEKERQQDYHVDTRALSIELQGTPEAPDFRLSVDNSPGYALTDISERQIAKFAHIPRGPGKGAAYYQYLRSTDPEALQYVLNRELSRTAGRDRSTRLLRTLRDDGNGVARAFLSDKFALGRDNYDLFEHIGPALQEKGVWVKSCDLTESRLYLKGVNAAQSFALDNGAVSPLTDTELSMIMSGQNTRPERDIHVSSVVISNSEVGLGSLSIEPGIARVWCYNLSIISEGAMRKRHVSKKVDLRDENGEIPAHFTVETQNAVDQAFWLSARDNLNHALSDDMFNEYGRKLAVAQGVNATDALGVDDPIKVVDITAQRHELTDGEKSLVLDEWFKLSDKSLFGLSNGVTAAAARVESYDRSTELERIAWSLVG